MRPWKKLLSAALASLPIACTSIPLPFSRTEYVLEHKGDLLVSNSEVFSERPTPDEKNGRFEIRYALFLQNRSSKDSIQVDLGKSHFMVNSHGAEIECKNGKLEPAKGALSLMPGAKQSLQCKIILSKAIAQTVRGDLKAFFKIPFQSPSHKDEISFLYVLKQEDFE
jgi:hypothetical protein